MSLLETVRPTTWLNFDQIDSVVGAKVWFASETDQVTGSFKYRAATSVVHNVLQKVLLQLPLGILVRHWHVLVD